MPTSGSSPAVPPVRPRLAPRVVTCLVGLGLILGGFGAPAHAAAVDPQTPVAPPGLVVSATTAPSAPGMPFVVEMTSTSITLSWTRPTADGDIAEYLVYRTQEGGMPVIAIVSADVAGAYPRVVFNQLVPGTTYTFRVAARDTAGNTSAYSDVLVVTTPDANISTCHVSYTIMAQWQNGFQVMVMLACDTDSPVQGWALRWTLPTGQTITQLWNASLTVSGNEVTVTNAAWNSSISANTPASFGFVASTTAGATAPSSFTINGQPCPVTS